MKQTAPRRVCSLQRGLEMSLMLKMLQSGEHERRAQIHGELQTGGWAPSQSEMRDCIFKIHSTGRNIKTGRGKLAWTRHPYIKLQIKYAHPRFKGIHIFIYFCILFFFQ